MNASRSVRIGGASGFWGDSAMATPQLLAVPGLQYLVYDYLAETTMAIMSRARARIPRSGTPPTSCTRPWRRTCPRSSSAASR